MFVGNLLDGRHVGALAVEVHRDDALRLRRDGGFDFGRVNAFCFWIAIHQDGGCAGNPDRFCRCKKRICIRDDFVAGPDPECHEGEPDRIRAVAGADGVFHAVERCQFLLELLVHRPVDVLAALQDLGDIGVDFLLDIVVLPNVSVESNLHDVFPFMC